LESTLFASDIICDCFSSLVALNRRRAANHHAVHHVCGSGVIIHGGYSLRIHTRLRTPPAVSWIPPDSGAGRLRSVYEWCRERCIDVIHAEIQMAQPPGCTAPAVASVIGAEIH